MKIHINKYLIQLSEQSNYAKGSTDNNFIFRHHYFNDREYQYNAQIGIKIYENEHLLTSAIICSFGGGTGVHKTSQVVDNEKIVICCADHIFNLSIPDLKLNWKVQADNATCFEIFKLDQDFIIHGELSISRVSSQGKIVWQKSGADIFTRIDAREDDFKVTENYIFATDWENRKYQFDFDGNEISYQ